MQTPHGKQSESVVKRLNLNDLYWFAIETIFGLLEIAADSVGVPAQLQVLSMVIYSSLWVICFIRQKRK